MAHKYQTFADLLYASYSGLQTLGYLPLPYPQPEDVDEELPIRNFQLQRLESKEDICQSPAADGCRIGHGRTNL